MKIEIHDLTLRKERKKKMCGVKGVKEWPIPG
jgi:hypothetical protein